MLGDDMLQNLPKQALRQLPTAADPMQGRMGSIWLAVAVGVAYFLSARLSLGLLTKPDGVAVFWPAAGVAAGGRNDRRHHRGQSAGGPESLERCRLRPVQCRRSRAHGMAHRALSRLGFQP